MSRTTILDDVTPLDLGLPAKFTTFRPVQREMVDYALYGPNGDGAAQRFTAMGGPAGCGKTMLPEAIGKISGKRIVTLTSTLSLMDQRLDDFEVSDIRGRSNPKYECAGVDIKGQSEVNCGQGFEHGCHLEGSLECPYSAAGDTASWGASVSTNYQYWMNARGANALALEKAGPIGILICDEAHLAVEELGRYLSTWVALDDVFSYAGITKGEVPWKGHAEEWGKVDGTWVQVLIQMAVAVRRARQDRLSNYDNSVMRARKDAEFRRLDALHKDLVKLTRHGSDGNWIWQLTKKGVRFDVIWPYRYAERYLFSGVQKVVMVSATLRPKLLGLLGLKRNEVDFKEWPRQFPAVLAPVYHLPTVKMSWRTSAEELKRMVDRVDEIVTARPGRKALVHTHSYKRAEYLQAHSRYGRYMVLNSSGAGYRGGAGLTAQQAAQRFKAMQPTADHPAILVGPSFTTGLDFEGVACETNIIVKVPWPDLSSPIMKARQEDEQYSAYVTMQDLVQACGRGQRSETDRCENWILDDGIANFQYYAKQHAPAWWRCHTITAIPKEPVKL